MIEGKLTLTTPEGPGRQFVAVSGSGHALVMDDVEGQTAAKPIELALLALGGCTAFRCHQYLAQKPAKVDWLRDRVTCRAESRAAELFHSR
jgi:uncharacterized OsmC-like protein